MSSSRKIIKESGVLPPRYYFDLKRKTRTFNVALEDKQWCDLWHQHFDWKGLGDKGWLHRRRHLTALLVALVRARQELKSANLPHQLFAIVHPRDSGSDAIYVHTENPNSTPFPITHTGQEVESLPSLLASRVDLSQYRVLSYGSGRERSYIIEPVAHSQAQRAAK
jgi:hypothetical protein